MLWALPETERSWATKVPAPGFLRVAVFSLLLMLLQVTTAWALAPQPGVTSADSPDFLLDTRPNFRFAGGAGLPQPGVAAADSGDFVLDTRPNFRLKWPVARLPQPGAAWGDSSDFVLDTRPNFRYGRFADSGDFTLDTRFAGVVTELAGVVSSLDAQGRARGPLAGAVVVLEGRGTFTTGSDGRFRFGGLSPGAFVLRASKEGYHEARQTVGLQRGENLQETLSLTARSTANAPSAFNILSPNGRHFIPGMPEGLTFEATVAWNGAPGSAFFDVAGARYAATLTDLGNGLAKATLSVPAPAVIPARSELSLEVSNGEGKTFTARPGVHFHPLPGLVVSWYGQSIPWKLAGRALVHAQELSWPFWEMEIPSGVWSSRASLGISGELAYDAVAGTIRESRTGFGSYSQTLEFADIENLGEGRLDFTRSLELSLGAGGVLSQTAGWEVSLSGKAGLGAPAVLVLDIVAPGAGSAAAKLPLIGDIKLRLYFIGGGAIAAEYEGNESGPCWWGASSLSASVTAGLEAQAVLDLDWADSEAGVYLRGTGTPEFQLCPEFRFEAITLRLCAGYFVETPLFGWSKEVGSEIRFERGRQVTLLSRAPPLPHTPEAEWRPLGARRLRWGDANRVVAAPQVRLASSVMPATTAEVTVVTNVIRLASPAVSARGSEALILFTLHDPAKPWHAATDIAVAFSGNGTWGVHRLTDDDAAESNPKLVAVSNEILLAAWSRVAGDISGATNPAQVSPQLEIVAAWLDRSAGAWTEPAQLTTNGVADRAPMPVVFGSTPAIIWVRGAGAQAPGNPPAQDSLMCAEWSGTEWRSPQTLWSAPGGIVSYGFTADAAGEGHLVIAVDEDGDSETRADRELYGLRTLAGQWQAAGRLTTDGVEDALPTLVAPGGAPLCVWREGTNLVYSGLGAWNPKPVYGAHTLANEAATLCGVTLPGGAAVAYTVQDSSGLDMVAAFYDAALDQWSLPRQLTHDEDAESALSLVADGASLVVAYTKTQTVRTNLSLEINGQVQVIENVPQPGRTDIGLLTHALGHDLAVAPTSLRIAPPNPAPGSLATNVVVVENRGDLAAQNLQVVFYDGHPQQGGVPIGAPQTLTGPLVGGAAREVSVVWAVPADLRSHDVYAIVDPGLAFDDRDRGNNIAGVRTVLADLTVETGWNTEVSASEVMLVAKVANIGALPTLPFEVSWRLAAPDGQEIARTPVGSLAAGGSVDVSQTWDTSPWHLVNAFAPVYAIADATGVVPEWNERNNLFPQTVRVRPAWAPRIVSIELRPPTGLRLLIEAFGAAAPDLVIESTGSLTSPIWWDRDSAPATATPLAEPGVFGVDIDRTDEARFYRIRLN